MIYLVDANVVMEAANTYYRHAWVPEFWMWLRHHADAGIIKMPIEIFSEIKDGTKDGTKDELFSWATDKGNKAALLLATEASPVHILEVLEKGYSTDLTDVQLQVIGQDPFLIAHALTDVAGRCVVTNEGSAPRAKVEKRKIPDACNSVGVKYCTPFQMMSALGFKTSWTP